MASPPTPAPQNQAWQIPFPSHLTLSTLPSPLPTPGPTALLIRLRAISLNYRDLLVLDHNAAYPFAHKPLLTPCSDGAGTIVAVGQNLTQTWERGDAVVVLPNAWSSGTDVRDFDVAGVMGGGAVDGVLQRYLCLPAERVMRAPKGLSWAEASCLFTAGVAAWSCLRLCEPRLGPGVKVLVLGTGGVSCWAMQIAAAAGATVLATSSSADKLERARQLGATQGINYRENASWGGEVLKATDGVGVDLVVEVAGGASLAQSLAALRPGGKIALVGVLEQSKGEAVDLTGALLYGGKSIQTVFGAGSHSSARDFAAFVEAHRLQPPIAQTFEFEEADKAFEALRTLNEIGKVVIEV